MLGEQHKSIKATGWIRAETPHYLLVGTPISSNWFDKCSSIHRMRDEWRDREPHRMTERTFYTVRFVKIRRLFPVANSNFLFTSDNFTTLNSNWNEIFEQELSLIGFAASKHIEHTPWKETCSLFGVDIRESELCNASCTIVTAKALHSYNQGNSYHIEQWGHDLSTLTIVSSTTHSWWEIKQ